VAGDLLGMLDGAAVFQVTVMPVVRNVWQHTQSDSPAALALRLTMSRAFLRANGWPVSVPVLLEAERNRSNFRLSAMPAVSR